MVGEWILYAIRLQGVLKIGITCCLTKRLANYATSTRRSQIEVIAAANLVAQTKADALQTETALHLALEQVDRTRERELFEVTHRTLKLAKDFIGFERDRYIEFLVSTRHVPPLDSGGISYELEEPSPYEMCRVPPLERWLHWKLMTGPSSATHYQLFGEFETLAKEVIAWCESKQLDRVPSFPTLAAEIRNLSARPEFSKRERIQVGGGRRVAGAERLNGWRVNKLEIEETWTRYGFYEENNPETFYYETDDESGGVITIRLP